MNRVCLAALECSCVAGTVVGSRLVRMSVALQSHQELWSSPDYSTHSEQARSRFSRSPLKVGRPPQARVEERSKGLYPHCAGSDIHQRNESIRKLDESFLRIRFDRLAPREKHYLRAMAELGPGHQRLGSPKVPDLPSKVLLPSAKALSGRA
jgi:hypothetical protein